MRRAGHVAHMEVRKGAYRILVEKSEAERPSGTRMHKLRGILKWTFKK
jgi:hypothetical protein